MFQHFQKPTHKYTKHNFTMTEAESNAVESFTKYLESFLKTKLLDTDGKLSPSGQAVFAEIDKRSDSPNAAVAYYRRLAATPRQEMNPTKFVNSFPHFEKQLLIAYVTWRMADSIEHLESLGISWDSILGQVGGLW